MEDAARHVHSRGTLALGGRFAGKSTRVIHSHAVIDRGSVFVAHLAFPVFSESEATAAVSALRRTCTGDVIDHAMSAWRVPKVGTVGSVGGGTNATKPAKPKKVKVASGFDDDGETRGGASIRAELNKRDAVGVACVVTRVYGGANLGKKRFEHIRERVRVLLIAAGLTPGTVASSDAFRGSGYSLGSGAGVAAALGGSSWIGGGVSNEWSASQHAGAGAESQSTAPNVQPNRATTGVSGSQINALFVRRTKTKKQVAKKLPASVADDIRERLAAAAERRRKGAQEEVDKLQPSQVVDLCGD